MFEFNTRTEIANGCKFLEQDVMLFDYLYHGDTEIEVHLDYNNPGFGLLLAEAGGDDITESENIYLFKLGTRNEYQIITKQYNTQYTLKNEYILAGQDGNDAVDLNLPFSNLGLLFKFTEDCKMGVYYITKDDNGINNETLLFSYELPHIIEEYKIGFYSNSGNIITLASVKSESPSNWTSNIFNGNGGRINWFDCGFQIEDCEYDCEVECQNNELEAGTYYFDFTCEDNPDIKYYIYPSSMRDTKTKRTLDEILATKEDEAKNILDYDTMSFTLDESHAVNIKFKGKFGTVKNIAIKQYKTDDFVETDYNTTTREGSYIKLDLNKIVKAEIEAKITSVPNKTLYEDEKYNLVLCGSKILYLTDFDLELNKTYQYVYENNFVKVNDITENLPAEQYLTMFKNMDCIISKFILTTITGETIDVLLQKTFKITVSENVKSPIMVTDEDENPYDLSSSFREIIQETRTVDTFNKYNLLHLSNTINLVNSDIEVIGVLSGNTIEDGITIGSDKYTIDYVNNKVIMDSDEKSKYAYVVIKYNSCDNIKYEFTNWEREIFELDNEQNLYINGTVCDVVNPVVAYGIKEDALLFEDRLYRINSSAAINNIDYAVDQYDILSSVDCSISSTGKINFSYGTRKKYKWLIIDYLKDKSYAINKREDWYEVDIATSDTAVKVIYDADEDGVTQTYSIPKISGNVEQNNFIVLKGDSE